MMRLVGSSADDEVGWIDGELSIGSAAVDAVGSIVSI